MTKKKSHPQSQPSGSGEQSLIARLAEGSRQMSGALSERQIIEALFDQLKQLDPSELALFQYKMVKDQPLWANLRAGWQTPFPAGTELYLPDSPLQKLLTSPTPLFIPDVSADSRLSRPEISALTGNGIRSAAFLPLACGGHSFGMVMTGYTQPFAFDPPARQILTLLTNQAGASLVNQLFIQKSAYRAVQMDAAAKIAQAVGAIHSLQELLDSSVELLCTHFDLHYAGVFLIDDTGQWAELQAGSGEAGRRQLQEGHRLKLDDSSMVGWAITHGQARIALDVGEEAVHFRTPYLPGTRSEMALPLRYHHQILGALTIQSTEPAAFSQEDIAFLQIIADQLAVGVENARLFAELTERETQNTVLLEAIPDLLFRINREGVFVAVKGPEETPTMIPLDEIPGKSLFDIFPPDFAQTRYEDIQRCLETGQPQHFEYSLPIGDDVGHFEARMVRSGEDEVLTIIRNITERKKAELALKRSEARYRELIESANSIILRLNPRGEVLFINRFAQEFFGYTEDEIVGKNVVGTIVPQNDMADREFRQLLAELPHNPDQYSTNINENMCRDGRIVWISWSNRAIRDESGQVSEILC
ncbi:MAG: PAS domain S-box protein, partial [Chloroflexi bacterium]